MRMYEDDFGDIIDEETARERALEDMNWDDYIDYFRTHVSFEDFFNKARMLPGFFEAFELQLMSAEDEFFNDNYTEVDVEEEDD